MPESKQVDHRAAALEALDKSIPKGVGIPESTKAPDYGRALVHSQLAIAEELKGIRAEVKFQGGYLEQAIREASGNV